MISNWKEMNWPENIDKDKNSKGFDWKEQDITRSYWKGIEKMANLDINEEKMIILSTIELKAIKVLSKALDDEGTIDDKANLAIKTMNVVAKNRQTLTSREGIRFQMAKFIANETQLRKYVESTQPEIKKLLGKE